LNNEPPVMIAVTGANGVGKSTLAEKISKERGMKFICPDVPQGESRHEETLALAAQHIARRESYAHDDVFRKTKVEQSILKAKAAGYWIEAQEGHGVPQTKSIGPEIPRDSRRRMMSRLWPLPG